MESRNGNICQCICCNQFLYTTFYRLFIKVNLYISHDIYYPFWFFWSTTYVVPMHSQNNDKQFKCYVIIKPALILPCLRYSDAHLTPKWAIKGSRDLYYHHVFSLSYYVLFTLKWFVWPGKCISIAAIYEVQLCSSTVSLCSFLLHHSSAVTAGTYSPACNIRWDDY